MLLLENKVAVVTGSGRGIGRAVAQLLAQHGAKVVINDLDPAPAEETAAAIRAAGGECLVRAGSITDPDFPEKIVADTLKSYGALDILVNNAGYTWDGV